MDRCLATLAETKHYLPRPARWPSVSAFSFFPFPAQLELDARWDAWLGAPADAIIRPWSDNEHASRIEEEHALGAWRWVGVRISEIELVGRGLGWIAHSVVGTVKL